ncbi:MAG TPA: ergothioneine biosynthesis protein EgtC [Streptosporangiaceae bacterium]|jgi:glutamine amidotransferase
MCRHVAYLGPPVSLREALIDPPYSLYRQSWAPRRQRFGTVNADGFGVGWYADGDPVPARYRRELPIWADDSFPDIARVTRTTALLAAVRSASEATTHGAAAAAPFAADNWLFSHNGRLDGWPSSAASLAASLPPAELLDLEARVDSALLWALILHRLRDGQPPPDAIAGTLAALDEAGLAGRFNFLLTDGRSIAASAKGDTLCYREAGDAITVASEPADDEPGWRDVPEGSVLTVRLHERIEIR